jgi:hypothetical protein
MKWVKKKLNLFWVLAFKVELLLLVHLLNATFTLKSFSAFKYIRHMKNLKGKRYGLNIIVASVTNSGASCL